MPPLKLIHILLITVCVTLAGCVTTTGPKAPVAIEKHRPQYPFELRRAGITGTAIVEFTVDTQGNVRDVSVVEATYPDFGRSAAACIAKWKFKPGMRDNVAVNVKLQQSFTFALNTN